MRLLWGFFQSLNCKFLKEVKTPASWNVGCHWFVSKIRKKISNWKIFILVRTEKTMLIHLCIKALVLPWYICKLNSEYFSPWYIRQQTRLLLGPHPGFHPACGNQLIKKLMKTFGLWCLVIGNQIDLKVHINRCCWL